MIIIHLIYNAFFQKSNSLIRFSTKNNNNFLKEDRADRDMDTKEVDPVKAFRDDVDMSGYTGKLSDKITNSYFLPFIHSFIHSFIHLSIHSFI